MNLNNNKILLVIPTLKQGGAERIMSELANSFVKLGHEVHLCLLANSESFYSVDPKVIIHYLGFQNKNQFQKKFSELNTFIKLRKLLKNERPQAVLSFMDKFNVLTILASRYLNLNVFVSDRSNPNKKIGAVLRYFKKMTYPKATGIIAQTSLAKKLLLNLTSNNNIRIIPNPLKEITPYPQIKKEKIILNVGRLVPEKGQKYLIEAFSLLQDETWKLVILGEGILNEELTNQIKNLNLGDRVIMPGAVKNVDEWLARSSIFGFPSISEGFPNALVEAMVAGLPCVSFDCDAGPRDIISHGQNGFLIDVGNVDSLTNSFKELCNNEALRNRIGEEAKKIKQKLDVSLIVNEYLDFFKENKE